MYRERVLSEANIMRKFTSLAVFASILVAMTLAAPASAKNTTLCYKAYGVREAVKKRHGDRAPGRNICRHGVQSKYNKDWSKDATTKQKAQYLRQLKSLIARPRYRQLVVRATPPKQAPAKTLTATQRVGGGSHLASIRACESGGSYRAVSPSGQYRGAYQFDRRTWGSVGGSGDPAAASPAEQDMRAARLYARRGAQPWPVCGR